MGWLEYFLNPDCIDLDYEEIEIMQRNLIVNILPKIINNTPYLQKYRYLLTTYEVKCFGYADIGFVGKSF